MASPRIATRRPAAPELAPLGQRPPSNGSGPEVPSLRRRRNVPGAVLGALVVAVCAFGIGSWALSVGHRTQVLVVSRSVPAGSVIQASDLTTAGVAADHSVSAIPAGDAGQVVGKVATDNLIPGTLLVRSEVGGGPQLPIGSSVVGLALKPGLFPAGLQPGDRVSVVDTPTQGGGSSIASVLDSVATVFSIGTSPDGTSTLVSVLVPSADASAVASAGAQGNVSLVLVGGG